MKKIKVKIHEVEKEERKPRHDCLKELLSKVEMNKPLFSIVKKLSKKDATRILSSSLHFKEAPHSVGAEPYYEYQDPKKGFYRFAFYFTEDDDIELKKLETRINHYLKEKRINIKNLEDDSI